MGRGIATFAHFVPRYGFSSEAEMLSYFYEENALSIRDMSGYLGRAPFTTIKDRMQLHGIAMRNRGGPNHTREQEDADLGRIRGRLTRKAERKNLSRPLGRKGHPRE